MMEQFTCFHRTVESDQPKNLGVAYVQEDPKMGVP